MAKINIQDQIASNKRKSVFLMILVFLVFISLSYVIGLIYDPAISYLFVIIALIISILFIIFSYYNSDKLVLSLANARPATKSEYRYLVNVVEGLAIAAGIPKPKIYVIDSNELNAFATGRDHEHGVICVTTGMLKTMNRSELEGVIAHEMSHIKNYDVRFATLVAVLVGIVVIISDFFRRSLWYSGGSKRDRESRGSALIFVGLLLALFAPIFVKLVQLAISRKREYLADANGAYLTRYPEGLASALEKIKNHNTGKLRVSEAIAPMFIAHPLSSRNVESIFSTHPPVEKRIQTLRSM